MNKRCRDRLRSETRKASYYELRKTPVCIWCDEPISDARKRKYHPECRADKNRLRVRAYNNTHKIKTVRGKARTFAGTVICLICGMQVQRSGARQVICKRRECVAGLKNKNKREAKRRNRLIEQMRAEKAARVAASQPRQASLFEVIAHRIRA
jgi:hypothetical protein